MKDLDSPIMVRTLSTFQKLPPTFKQLISTQIRRLSKPKSPSKLGKSQPKLLTDKLCGHLCPDSPSFEDEAIQCYQDFLFLLNKEQELNDMIDPDNGILTAS